MTWSIEMLIVPFVINLIAAVSFFVLVQPRLEASRMTAREREKKRIEYVELIRKALLNGEQGFWVWSIINSDMQQLLLRYSISVKLRLFMLSFFAIAALGSLSSASYMQGFRSTREATNFELTFIYSSGCVGLLMAGMALYQLWLMATSSSAVQLEIDSYKPLLDEIRELVIAKANRAGE